MRTTPRRLRWFLPALLVLVWLVVGGVGGPFAGKLGQVQSNDSASFLPASAEATQVAELQKAFSDTTTSTSSARAGASSPARSADGSASCSMRRRPPSKARPSTSTRTARSSSAGKAARCTGCWRGTWNIAPRCRSAGVERVGWKIDVAPARS